ncbi:hypothetical protein ABZ215_13605 [Amycolatopsis sp. NPDC006131]|uniref:hypothetical protein n=1 Tax=Amycolatopsis sp. NPDC006131 TaxID=3156731 RepID=UPI0033A03511
MKVKPGTARRLGLRQPAPRPVGVLELQHELTPAEMAEFARQFADAIGTGQPRVVIFG